jgi:hypothetical protein
MRSIQGFVVNADEPQRHRDCIATTKDGERGAKGYRGTETRGKYREKTKFAAENLRGTRRIEGLVVQSVSKISRSSSSSRSSPARDESNGTAKTGIRAAPRSAAATMAGTCSGRRYDVDQRVNVPPTRILQFRKMMFNSRRHNFLRHVDFLSKSDP